VRDALTVFDENGALLQCPDALWEALANKDWQRLFVTGRHLWQQTQLVLFGHALMEKLLSPRKGMVTHVYRLNTGLALADIAQTDPDFIAHLDRHLAETLTPRQLASKPFAPLPVLGVPGWWPPNEAPGFYDDVAVFRPPRHPPESCQPQSAPAAHGRQS
jgi:hypothetical protein